MRVTWSGIGFHDADWQSAFGVLSIKFQEQVPTAVSICQ